MRIPDGYVTYREAAKLVGRDKRTLRRWKAEGRIQVELHDDRIRIMKREDVLEVEAQMTEAILNPQFGRRAEKTLQACPQ